MTAFRKDRDDDKGHGTRRPTRMVFFDAGGTLIQPWPSVGGVYARLTEELGVAVEPSRFEEVLYPIWNEYRRRSAGGELPASTSDEQDLAMWRHMATRVFHRIPELEPIPFETWFEAAYEAFASGQSWRPYDEVTETLDLLAERSIQVGIVSNWSSRLARILEHLELHHHFTPTVISSVVGYRKPDPRIFTHALDTAGVDPTEAVHIGDTYSEDVLGAEAAGVLGLWIDRSTAEPHEQRRHVTIRSLVEVTRFL